MTPPAPGPGGQALLGQLAGMGPFFALQVHDAGTAPLPPWRPFTELLDDPAQLRGRVDDVRAYLASAGGVQVQDVELRVAASVVQLGITARLVSPALGLAVLAGFTPSVDRACLDLTSLRWQNTPGAAVPLSVPDDLIPSLGQENPSVAGLPDPAPSDSDRWAAAVVEGPVRAVAGAFAAFSLSTRVLWGNAASAISGATSALGASAPDQMARARRLARHLLGHPALRDASAGDPGSPGFRRRSCCLIYRADPSPKPALCGDCVLRTTPPGPGDLS